MTAVAVLAAIGAFLLGLRLDQSGPERTLARVKTAEWTLGLAFLALAVALGAWLR